MFAPPILLIAFGPEPVNAFCVMLALEALINIPSSEYLLNKLLVTVIRPIEPKSNPANMPAEKSVLFAVSVLLLSMAVRLGPATFTAIYSASIVFPSI